MTATDNTTVNLSQRAIHYLSAINSPGAYTRMVWERKVSTAAAYKGMDVRKRVEAVVRTGIDYQNLAVNEGRKTGDLPYGEWAVFPHIITHKGREYARLYLGGSKPKATYTIDGQDATRAQVMELMTPSARKAMLEGDAPDAFNVKMEDVVSIG